MMTNSQTIKLPQRAALPVRFDGCAGFFMPVAGSPAVGSAVLLVSPWGFEDMCVRKFYREIAEALSVRGIASLRFDFPGTGDSADIDPGPSTLETWLVSIIRAAGELQRLAGTGNIILAGHGLGATLALLAANRLENVTGLALLAPVTSGRSYIREIGLWWKMIASDLGLPAEQAETGSVNIAGFEMPAEIEAEIRQIKTTALRLEKPVRVLAVNRASRDGDTALADAIEADGATVRRIDYEGYESLVVNPLLSIVPHTVVDGIADWAEQISSGTIADRQPPAKETATASDGYRETGIRFGPNLNLVGTLCEPSGDRHGASVVIVGTGYDRASGWARIGTRMARHFARRGIASLRFDAAGVADSPPVPGDPLQVLYGDTLNRDVAAALEEMTRRLPGPAILSGRCSGGYHAFHVASEAPSCAGFVAVNPYTFIWDPRQIVDEMLTATARPLSDYSRRALDPETFRRLLKGDINVKSAAMNILRKVGEHFGAKFFSLLGTRSEQGQRAADVRAAFARLQSEDRQVLLLYGDHDIGLDEFRLAFGKHGEKLKSFPNASFRSLGMVDHNITLPAVQDDMISAIAEFALKTG